MRKQSTRLLIGSTVCVAGIVGASAGSAFAGENKGNGEKNLNSLNSQSACSFSGLDELGFGEQTPDDPDGLFFGAPGFEFDRTQNFGQLVRFLEIWDPQDVGAGPAVACNGSGG